MEEALRELHALLHALGVGGHAFAPVLGRELHAGERSAGLVAEFRKSRHLERAALKVRAPLERLYKKVAGGPPIAPPGPLPEDADTLANAAASAGTAVHAVLDAATAGRRVAGVFLSP